MLGIHYGLLLVGWSCSYCLLIHQTSGCTKDNEWVRFDVPAMLVAFDLDADGQEEGFNFLDHSSETANHDPPGRPGKKANANSELTPAMKKIGIIVPLTAELNDESGVTVNSLRFDIFWNKNPFPLFDYSPKTITTSAVAGTVAVERFEEQNQDLGGQLNGTYPPFLTGFIRANQGDRHGEKTRFEEIPQHHPYVSSGPVRRGTGAYFRFHPSRTDILEGGREVRLSFHVPASWRGGILQVVCSASGVRKKFAWQDVAWEHQRVFVAPVHLSNDEQAWQQAMNFAQSEQELRSQWRSYQQNPTQNRQQSFQPHFTKQSGSAKTSPWSETNRSDVDRDRVDRDRVDRNGVDRNEISSNHQTLFKPLPMMIGLHTTGTDPSAQLKLPADWIHVLIQHNDKPLETYRHQLPRELESAAAAFVKSRIGLLQLSR